MGGGAGRLPKGRQHRARQQHKGHHRPLVLLGRPGGMAEGEGGKLHQRRGDILHPIVRVLRRVHRPSDCGAEPDTGQGLQRVLSPSATS